MSWYGAVVALLAMGTSSWAATDLQNKVGDCATIAADAERLRCFDVLAKSLDAKGKKKSGQPRTDWIVSSRVSPMDDKTNVYLMLRADRDIETKFFGKVRPRLWIQCVGGKTKGVLEWGFIVGGGKETITYRLDREKAVAAVVNVSDDFSALVSWDEKRFIPFVKSLFGKNRLLVEIKPFSDPPLTAGFNIAGTEKVIAPLRAACGW